MSKKQTYREEFLNGVRNNFKNMLTAISSEAGGYLIPEELHEKIISHKENDLALENLVRVMDVTSNKGCVRLRKRTIRSPFNKISENMSLPEIETPGFNIVNYEVDKYGGIFKISEELLEDFDENSNEKLEDLLADWLANDSIATRNKLILEVLGKKEKTTITGLDDIKDAVNKKLKPVFKRNAIILTNQDGFNWLDNLEDSNGRGFIKMDETTGEPKLFGRYAIKELDNNDLMTVEGKVPMIIGDIYESCILFDRKQLSLINSSSLSNEFTMGVHTFRSIEKEQVKLWDEESFIYGQVDIDSK